MTNETAKVSGIIFLDIENHTDAIKDTAAKLATRSLNSQFMVL